MKRGKKNPTLQELNNKVKIASEPDKKAAQINIFSLKGYRLIFFDHCSNSL